MHISEDLNWNGVCLCMRWMGGSIMHNECNYEGKKRGDGTHKSSGLHFMLLFIWIFKEEGKFNVVMNSFSKS